MMKRFKMDYELSKRTYEQYSALLEKRGCYTNVANIVIDRAYRANRPNIKIAFGAWQVPLNGITNVFARHCFLIEDDKIIDPTFFTIYTEFDNRDYLIFKTYDIDEYLDKLAECEGDTYLGEYSEPMFNQKLLSLKEKEIILMG